MADDCIFCRIAAGTIPAELVVDEDDLLAFRDLNPQAPVHVLVIPRRHVPTTNDLEGADADLVGRLVLAAQAIAAREGLRERGYRLVVNCLPEAGQTVYHLHLHLLGGRRFSWPPG